MPEVTDHEQILDTLYTAFKNGEQIAAHFRFGHLPPAMQEVSVPFARLAAHLILTQTRTAERTVALRKLLESKDAAVRGALPEWTR